MRQHPLWLRAGWALHRAVDRLSGGRLGRSLGRAPTLWLTTMGPIPVVLLGPRR